MRINSKEMITKEQIVKKIVKKKKLNIFLSHLFLLINKDINYYGEINDHEILLWRSSFFLRIGYPIFVLKFDENNYLKEIGTKKNPLAKAFTILGLTTILIYIFYEFMISEFQQAFFKSVVILVMTLLFYLLSKKIIKFETKNQIDELNRDISKLKNESSNHILY